jgi:hypothetical protein
MNWTVLPKQGLDPMQFGMTRYACEDLLGPGRGMKTFTGSWREIRGPRMPILTFVGDLLVEIEVLPQVQNVRFEGMDVFATDPTVVLREFYRSNKGALAGVGSVLFLELGINTTGFIDLKTLRFRNNPDERSITVFKSGQFDGLLENYSDFRMLV